MSLVNYDDRFDLPPIDYDQSKVPRNIKERADGVREAVFGTQNKEFIAQAVEIAGVSVTEALEAQAYDGNSLADVTLAKDGLPTLDARIKRDVNNLENKKADKDEVTAQLAQKASKQELVVERSRIDGIATLAQGSTTGDAELMDLRVGADGVTYTNAGEAVRNQLKEINEDLGRVFPSITQTKDKYINASGVIVSVVGYFYSQPIYLKAGQKISVVAKGVNQNVAMISKASSDGVSDIVPLVISIDSTIRDYEYTAYNDMYVVVSGDYRVEFTITKATEFASVTDLDKLNNELSSVAIDYSVLFSKAVFIGDSLTRGFYAEYPSGERNRSFSYPSTLAQKTNWDTTNLGISGATASNWYQTHQNTDLSGYDIAFICLGRNGKYEDSADINAYNQIITKLKAESPNAVIFVLSLPPSNDGAETTVNVTVKSIANNNNLPYLDIATTGVMNQKNGYIYRPADGVHFNKVGYATLALTILEQMNRYITENIEEFTDLYVAP